MYAKTKISSHEIIESYVKMKSLWIHMGNYN